MKVFFTLVSFLLLTCCIEDKKDVSEIQKEIIDAQDEIFLTKKQHAEADQARVEAEKKLIVAKEEMHKHLADALEKLLEAEEEIAEGQSIISRQNADIAKARETILNLSKRINEFEANIAAEKERLAAEKERINRSVFEWEKTIIVPQTRYRGAGIKDWNVTCDFSLRLQKDRDERVEVIFKRKFKNLHQFGMFKNLDIIEFSFFDKKGFPLWKLTMEKERGRVMHLSVRREYVDEDGSKVTLGRWGGHTLPASWSDIHLDATKVSFTKQGPGSK